MFVEIDENSGFCFGVVTAITKAEEELTNGPLYSLGDIVHNSKEVARLEDMGLKTIEIDQLSDLAHSRVLFRAHGEPPTTYKLAKDLGIEVIDASCPVVLNLQRKVKDAWKKCQANNGQVVIYGKKGHAEVTGLVGQTDGNAIVVEHPSEVNRIDCSRPVYLFSQTTQGLDGFKKIEEALQNLCGNEVTVFDSICRKVANRIPQLKDFAKMHDVIIFVSGKKSSNGKQLFEVCRSVNERTYFVESEDQLEFENLKGMNSVGITGATSTPRWIMERVKDSIESHFECVK